MRHGEHVSAFESAFAEYANARYAVAMTNGTVTIQVALMALGLKPGDRVATTPLTMAATTIAILNAGGVPVYEDVDPETWIMAPMGRTATDYSLPVSLYGLHQPFVSPRIVDDAAQTLREHGGSAFSSFSLQRSKILQTGEGGVLVTNDEELATAAREIASLGYKLGSSQSRIDSNAIKSPTFDRHHRAVSLNARMNDLTAAEALWQLDHADRLKDERRTAAMFYRLALGDCEWIRPQHVPEGWKSDYWAYAVACDTPERAVALQAAMQRLGAEVPYGCWKVTYHEPAFARLGVDQGIASRNFLFETEGTLNPPSMVARRLCPVAESLQPRILAFQTNSLASAERNASALRRAIEEMS